MSKTLLLSDQDIQNKAHEHRDDMAGYTGWVAGQLCNSGRDRLTEDEYRSIMTWANSFQRFHVFWLIAPHIPDVRYWEWLQSAYKMSDNLYRYRQQVREVFSANIPGRDTLMTIEEREVLRGLPDTLVIHRGMTVREAESGEYGVSWTLKREVAEFFSTVYCRNFDTSHEEKTVLSLEVPKRDVVAYWADRDEQEIIYLHPGQSRPSYG